MFVGVSPFPDLGPFYANILRPNALEVAEQVSALSLGKRIVCSWALKIQSTWYIFDYSFVALMYLRWIPLLLILHLFLVPTHVAFFLWDTHILCHRRRRRS